MFLSGTMANTSTNTAKGHASNVVWKSFDHILDIRNLFNVKSHLDLYNSYFLLLIRTRGHGRCSFKIEGGCCKIDEGR